MRECLGLVLPTTLLRMGTWRYPFFLVDKIVEFKRGARGYVLVQKNVSFNEAFFGGHFPDNPVMPGVLIAEVMGQACEYLTFLNEFSELHETRHQGKSIKTPHELASALNDNQGIELIEEIRSSSHGFLAGQDIKFKTPVLPGDILEVKSELKLADGNGFYHYQVEARIGRKTACTGRIINFRAPKSELFKKINQ